MTITPPAGQVVALEDLTTHKILKFGPGCEIKYSPTDKPTVRSEAFEIRAPVDSEIRPTDPTITLPAKCSQIIKGSSWGTFTIACTIPIALFVGLWMYRIRKERIFEASCIGGLLVLGAVVAGAWIPGSSLEPYFSLSRNGTILALCIYGFIAAVLPIWLLLTPRDYLSSFMKIGTLFLLIVGVIVANPPLEHPPINPVFQNGGPTFPVGGIFPFVFICVMCGAISGFHSLVASGTTPKMIDKESDCRCIGYGAMLMEGLVGVVALIAAASMPPDLYYAINVDVELAPKYQKQLEELKDYMGTRDPMHTVGVRELHQLDLGQIEESVGGESLRGRTGGAVTLAVSMATILTDAFRWLDIEVSSWMKYWYHFAIMFEALFILTTIDAGTRIARYLFQEALGKVVPSLASPKSIIGACLATFLVTAGWGSLVATGQISTIWPMFGIANQLLSVLALSLVSTYLIQHGKAKYAWVTILPMLFVTTTTLTAGKLMVQAQYANIQLGTKVSTNALNMGLTIFIILLVSSMLLTCVSRWIVVLRLGSKKKEIS
jgi:carbon starvation protein